MTDIDKKREGIREIDKQIVQAISLMMLEVDFDPITQKTQHGNFGVFALLVNYMSVLNSSRANPQTYLGQLQPLILIHYCV